MAKPKNFSTTIAIDAERSMFHFYSMVGNDKSTITHFVKTYRDGPMDEAFFGQFKEAVQRYTQRVPSQTVRKITVVLPERAVLTDTVRVPTMKGMEKTQQTSLTKTSSTLPLRYRLSERRSFPISTPSARKTSSLWIR